MTGRLESEVLAGILAYLGTRTDLLFWRQNTGGAEMRGTFVRFGIPGAPDVLAAQAPMGRMIGIEVKREGGGALSPDQKWFGEMLTAHGGLYVVARSILDVVTALGESKARVQKRPRRTRVYPR